MREPYVSVRPAKPGVERWMHDHPALSGFLAIFVFGPVVLMALVVAAAVVLYVVSGGNP